MSDQVIQNHITTPAAKPTTIDNQVIKITVAVFIGFMLAVCTFVWQIASAYSTVGTVQKQLEEEKDLNAKQQEIINNLVTKDDLKTAVSSLKDYINKH